MVRDSSKGCNRYQCKGLNEYVFVPSSERLIGVKSEYWVYHVEQKEKRRSMINPFERRAV